MAFWDGWFDRINNAARTAVMSWLNSDGTPKTADVVEERIQDMVALARAYYDGNHTVHLTKRQKAWLQLHGTTVRFTVNHCPTVVDAVVERLSVTGFKTQDETLSKQLWTWWTANRMDAIQTEAHRAAVKDGEAFILVSWNKEEGRPEYTFHPRFVDTANKGDGYGMWIEYPNGDYLSKPLYAVKQWMETEESSDPIFNRHTLKTITYRTVYYPDRVEKWRMDGGKWVKRQEQNDTWTANGKPIGIPVVHLRNPGCKSELRDAIPLQDALNKSWIDILASGDASGFQTLAFLGWIPTTDGGDPKEDGSNLVEVAPGNTLGTLNPSASVQVIPPASAQPLLEIEDRVVIRIASVTSTPLSRFQTSRQVAAEGTLQQQEGPLLSKVKERQNTIGNAWEDVQKLAIKVANAFGGQSLDEMAEISTVWMKPETRNELGEVQVAEGKKRLGIPDKTLWGEMGYTPEQIAEMEASEQYQATVANRKMATLNYQDMNDAA